MNPYGYVGQSPTQAVDVFGLQEGDDGDAGTGLTDIGGDPYVPIGGGVNGQGGGEGQATCPTCQVFAPIFSLPKRVLPTSVVTGPDTTSSITPSAILRGWKVLAFGTILNVATLAAGPAAPALTNAASALMNVAQAVAPTNSTVIALDHAKQYVDQATTPQASDELPAQFAKTFLTVQSEVGAIAPLAVGSGARPAQAVEAVEIVVEEQTPAATGWIQGPAATEARAAQIQAAGPLPSRAQTVTLLETAEGPTLAAGGGTDLSPAQKAIAEQLGCTLVPDLPGLHAEETALTGAYHLGVTPTFGDSDASGLSAMVWTVDYAVWEAGLYASVLRRLSLTTLANTARGPFEAVATREYCGTSST